MYTVDTDSHNDTKFHDICMVSAEIRAINACDKYTRFMFGHNTWVYYMHLLGIAVNISSTKYIWLQRQSIHVL